MDELDRLIKEFLERSQAARSRSAASPDAEDYHLYLAGAMEGEALDRMLEHLREDEEARRLILRARELLENSGEALRERVPDRSLAQAKGLYTPSRSGSGPSPRCPHCGGAITPFKGSPAQGRLRAALWLTAAAAAFAASFFVPRYFLQFLALALLFGIRWALDARASRTRVLIYKALQEGAPGAERDHLHRASGHL